MAGPPRIDTGFMSVFAREKGGEKELEEIHRRVVY
jgi:hypothetical protein